MKGIILCTLWMTFASNSFSFQVGESYEFHSATGTTRQYTIGKQIAHNTSSSFFRVVEDDNLIIRKEVLPMKYDQKVLNLALKYQVLSTFLALPLAVHEFSSEGTQVNTLSLHPAEYFSSMHSQEVLLGKTENISMHTIFQQFLTIFLTEILLLSENLSTNTRRVSSYAPLGDSVLHFHPINIRPSETGSEEKQLRFDLAAILFQSCNDIAAPSTKNPLFPTLIMHYKQHTRCSSFVVSTIMEMLLYTHQYPKIEVVFEKILSFFVNETLFNSFRYITLSSDLDKDSLFYNVLNSCTYFFYPLIFTLNSTKLPLSSQSAPETYADYSAANDSNRNGNTTLRYMMQTARLNPTAKYFSLYPAIERGASKDSNSLLSGKYRSNPFLSASYQPMHTYPHIDQVNERAFDLRMLISKDVLEQFLYQCNTISHINERFYQKQGHNDLQDNPLLLLNYQFNPMLKEELFEQSIQEQPLQGQLEAQANDFTIDSERDVNQISNTLPNRMLPSVNSGSISPQYVSPMNEVALEGIFNLQEDNSSPNERAKHSANQNSKMQDEITNLYYSDESFSQEHGDYAMGKIVVADLAGEFLYLLQTLTTDPTLEDIMQAIKCYNCPNDQQPGEATRAPEYVQFQENYFNSVELSFHPAVLFHTTKLIFLYVKLLFVEKSNRLSKAPLTGKQLEAEWIKQTDLLELERNFIRDWSKNSNLSSEDILSTSWFKECTSILATIVVEETANTKEVLRFSLNNFSVLESMSEEWRNVGWIIRYNIRVLYYSLTILNVSDSISAVLGEKELSRHQMLSFHFLTTVFLRLRFAGTDGFAQSFMISLVKNSVSFLNDSTKTYLSIFDFFENARRNFIPSFNASLPIITLPLHRESSGENNLENYIQEETQDNEQQTLKSTLFEENGASSKSIMTNMLINFQLSMKAAVTKMQNKVNLNFISQMVSQTPYFYHDDNFLYFDLEVLLKSGYEFALTGASLTTNMLNFIFNVDELKNLPMMNIEQVQQMNGLREERYQNGNHEMNKEVIKSIEDHIVISDSPECEEIIMDGKASDSFSLDIQEITSEPYALNWEINSSSSEERLFFPFESVEEKTGQMAKQKPFSKLRKHRTINSNIALRGQVRTNTGKPLESVLEGIEKDLRDYSSIGSRSDSSSNEIAKRKVTVFPELEYSSVTKDQLGVDHRSFKSFLEANYEESVQEVAPFDIGIPSHLGFSAELDESNCESECKKKRRIDSEKYTLIESSPTLNAEDGVRTDCYDKDNINYHAIRRSSKMNLRRPFSSNVMNSHYGKEKASLNRHWGGRHYPLKNSNGFPGLDQLTGIKPYDPNYAKGRQHTEDKDQAFFTNPNFQDYMIRSVYDIGTNSTDLGFERSNGTSDNNILPRFQFLFSSVNRNSPPEFTISMKDFANDGSKNFSEVSLLNND